MNLDCNVVNIVLVVFVAFAGGLIAGLFAKQFLEDDEGEGDGEEQD